MIKNGCPFDVAFQMDDVTRTASCIVLSEFEGGVFNWQSMAWQETT